MLKKMTLLTIFIFIFTALGCNKRQTITAKPPVAVELATASTSELVEGIEVTGNLEPKFSVDVKTQIAGLVKDVYVTQWVSVRKGQPLARIDISENVAIKKRAEASVMAGKAQLAQAQVTLKRAEREEARNLKLKSAGLATQQAVDDSHTETEAAKARVEAAKAQLLVYQEELQQGVARVAKGLVVSPLDGVIALRDVNVGDLANDAAAGKPIFRVVDNRILNLTVTVPSVDSAKVAVGQPLEFKVDALPGKTFNGRVMFINPELNVVDRSLKVVAEVQNSHNLLKGGLFAKGRIVTGRRSGVLQVSRAVLGNYDTTSHTARIFVADGQTASLRQVKTGVTNGEQVEIMEGLKPSEQYIVRGGFTLKDGDRITVQAAGAVK